MASIFPVRFSETGEFFDAWPETDQTRLARQQPPGNATAGHHPGTPRGSPFRDSS